MQIYSIRVCMCVCVDVLIYQSGTNAKIFWLFFGGEEIDKINSN